MVDETWGGCRRVLGSPVVEAIARAREFLEQHDTGELLDLVGQTLDELALGAEVADKRCFPVSYGGGKSCDDDLLTGLGMFYITQAGKVMLDCTSGHYQMTWGYNHPALTAAAAEAMELGVVWDNHSNIPSVPVKELAERLVAIGGANETGPDRILLGLCTGSAACGAGLKIMLTCYLNDSERSSLGPPVMVSLSGNYHGTDIVAQTLRGMWPGLLAGMETVQVKPNDDDQLKAAFRQYGKRIAGFWAEPLMMNCEAVLLQDGYLRLARRLCTENGALMAWDEIQTGFWYPEVFLFRQLEIAPDLAILGKGLTAGFHSLSGVLYRHELDILEQYDAISTNGNASLAALIGLCNLQLLEQDRDRLAAVAARHYSGLCELASQFPSLVETVNGKGLLTGLKFRNREDALGFYKAAVERGLWLRVHAYHPGHRTVLMKYALVVEDSIIDFVLGVLEDLLKTTPWR